MQRIYRQQSPGGAIRWRNYTPIPSSLFFTWAGALVQWLKMPAWKVVGWGIVPHSGIQVSKKHHIFPLLTCKQTGKDSILWRASVTER